jgi:hypothetical protein
MKAGITICLVLMLGVLLRSGGLAQANTWTTFDYSDARGTYAQGISGSNIVGYYTDASNQTHGFLYDGTNWAVLDAPGTSSGTKIYGIDGSSLVGVCNSATSFLYDGSAWTMLNIPNMGSVIVSGISGGNLVGTGADFGFDMHGVIYDGITWTRLDAPGNNLTYMNDIDGSRVVGNVGSGHGFVYDGTEWTFYDMPVTGAHYTAIYGISANNLVGQYTDASGKHHGFLFDGTAWTILDAPGAMQTYVTDIDGSNIVGYYQDARGNTHGFLYTIPEPATLLLFGTGVLLLRKSKRGMKSIWRQRNATAEKGTLYFLILKTMQIGCRQGSFILNFAPQIHVSRNPW